MSGRRKLAISLALLFLCSACSTEPLPGGDTSAPPAAVPSSAGETSSATPSAAAGPDAVVPEGPYWPRFHGPRGDNISTDTGLLKEWPEGGPPLEWTAQGIGHGFSGVTIAEGSIYTDGNIGGQTVITALDSAGQIRWQTPNGKAWEKSRPGTRGTPTVDGGQLYHESPLGQLVCLNAKTGEKIWGLNILEEFGGENITWGLAESLLVDGNHLICCPGGPQASVVALDKRTGKTVWKAPGAGNATSYASPALAECQGLRMILTMNAKALIGVNADGGDLLFQFKHVAEYDVNAMMPIYHDGRVFISSGYGSGSALVKLNVRGNKAGVEQVWESDQLDNHHGGVILLDGYLYGASHNSNGGKWICLDWKTGRMMYAERGVGKGSLTCADGMLYTLSEQRRMGLVAPTPTGHKLLSRFEVPSGGEGPSWAHPVVCGGHLYVRHDDRLFAYDVRAEP